MTTGTVTSFDPRRGRGTLQTASGTLVPFSSASRVYQPGTAVRLGIVGGMAGLYAVQVAPLAGEPRAQRQTATSSSRFRVRSGTLAPLAG